MTKHQKQFLSFITLIILGGCNFNFNAPKSPPVINFSQLSKDCPTQPPSELILRDPEDRKLDNTLKEIGKGKMNSQQTVGYRFQGEKGQNLQFELETNEVCLWIINPSNRVFTEKTLTEDGTYLVQLSTTNGKTLNYRLSMGLDINPPSPSPTSSPSPKPTPSPSPISKFSQDDAVELVKKWYDAKQRIFGSNYQTSDVNQYTTGRLKYETIEKCNEGVCGGSVGWLKQYGCYYTYDSSEIKRVINFNSSDSQATLTVNVRETLQLNGPSAPGCGKPQETYQKNVQYFFKKEGNKWKISEYQVRG